MKTKFILHGGVYTRKTEHPTNKKFFKMLIDSQESPIILGVYFAKENDTYEDKYREDVANLERVSEGKKFELIMATEENFLEQLDKVNVIYLRGGDTKKLLKTLKEYPEFKDKIKGKVVAGASAGVYVLAKYYYTRSEDDILEGLNILPIKSITHFGGDQKIVDRLKEFKEDLEMVVLEESDLKVMEIDL